MERTRVSAAWTAYVDVVLQRAALVARIARDRLPDPLAGLRISDDDMLRALAELPGLEAGEGTPAVDELLLNTTAVVADARSGLLEQITEGDLSSLVRGCMLTVSEAEVLAFLIAVELDPRRQRLISYINDDVAARWITPHTIQTLLPEQPDAVLSLGPASGLQRACLLRAKLDAEWGSTSVRVHADVMWHLLGDRTLSSEIAPGAQLLSLVATGSEHLVVAAGVDRIRRMQAVVSSLDARCLLLTPAPPDPASWDALVRRASVLDAGVVVEVDDDLDEYARGRIEQAPHLAWAIASLADLPLGSLPRRPWTHVPVADASATAEEVEAVLGPDVHMAASLSMDQLESVAVATRAMGGDVGSAVRRLAAGNIQHFAERIVPSRTWDDLVLPELQRGLVGEIVTRTQQHDTVFNRWGFGDGSSGVLAMFSGPSGTGKTLTAEVLAGELGVDLYRVDLSKIVDKYIGETEKKLAAVFAAAEASPMVLFFDEADALVGKRTDVSSAHDRHANIEVAYLLQRVERHKGVVIMATNLAGNIDTAFLRRIHVSVHFTNPDVTERARIWHRNIPPGVPLGDLPIDVLAEQLELSGGQIRNIAVRAAFLAAEAGSALTIQLIAAATEREMRKAGRVWLADRLLAGR